MHEISALIRETWIHCYLCIRENSKKTVIYEPVNGSSLDTESSGILIWDFPTFRPVRYIFLLFEAHSLP